LIRITVLSGLILLYGSAAIAQDAATDTRPGIAPDIREDESRLKLQRGDFVVVPIPISNPTLGDGLVAGAAYFYPQTVEEKKLQPASLTAAAGMYTSNDSKALAFLQQNYWKDGKWRFTGVLGAADLRLGLLAPDQTSSGQSIDWRIKGSFVFAKLARKLKGDWYGGVLTRVIDANQSLDLKVDALFNDERIGSNKTYQSSGAAFRSYHQLNDSLVLAWELQGCHRGGGTPLWDACTIKLRGFSATDYLGKVTGSGQVEARWRLNKRWGLVGFAGAGYVGNSFSGVRDNETIPSYGAGIRFMVLQAKRINLRVDYARSTDSDAIHVSVGEAF